MRRQAPIRPLPDPLEQIRFGFIYGPEASTTR